MSESLDHLRTRTLHSRIGGPTVAIVDLFAGCGALTLGALTAVRAFGLTPAVVFAADTDPVAVAVYRDNFPTAEVTTDPVETLLDGELGDPLTDRELSLSRAIGPVHILLGGPPCQGHSDLNNHTRRVDPRNSLYARMARAIEVLRPEVAIIENVPTVVHASEGVVETTHDAAAAVGYRVASGTIDLSKLGVPQRRRRHVLVATSKSSGATAESVVARICAANSAARTVGWAIADLRDATNGVDFEAVTKLSPDNAARIKWLFEHDEFDLPNELRPPSHRGPHSYVSMYGRLRWDAPAQTITTGFGSMGQGRFVHPLEARMLTAHEAARLQGIPDYHRFDMAPNRTSMRRLIGNAVPPPLSEAILRATFEEALGTLDAE